MILRPRQEQFVSASIAALQAHRNTLGIAPTGAGKTVMLSAVAQHFLDSGARILVLQHRDELVTQNRQAFHAFAGFAHKSGVVDAKEKVWRHPITYAMVQTLANHVDKIPDDITGVITDEGHHGVAPSYRKVYDRLPDAWRYFVTASPSRSDGKTLRPVCDNIADQITLKELVLAGALVPPRAMTIDVGVTGELVEAGKIKSADHREREVARILDTADINRRVVEAWKEHAGDRSTVVFGSTVDQAQHALEAFHAAGVSAEIVTDKTPDRAALLRRFDRGEFQVIVNVAVLTEGWDCQHVGCVILLRKESHISILIQMVGRGLRRLDPERYPGWSAKRDCIVLDFGASLATYRSLEPEIDIDPEREKDPKATHQPCPGCGAMIPVKSIECGLCGHSFLPPDGAGEPGEALPAGATPDFVMREIDVLNASPFLWKEPWAELPIIMASGFDAWACCLEFGGDWHAIGGSETRGAHRLADGDKSICIAMADDWMRDNADRKNVRKSRSWLYAPASDKQRQWLGLGAHEEIGLTKYQAACRMTFKMQERSIRHLLQVPRG